MSIIGLDMGATKIKAGLLSQGNLKKVVSQKIKAQGTEKEIIKQITDLLDCLMDKKIRAIGVGVPGIVDIEKGIVFEVVNIPSWKKVALGKILSQKYSLPTYINNDANCFALGEKYFGQAKKYDKIAAVTIGSGMGTGIIIDNKLYAGHNGGAGEFGQIIYKEGVMEQYSSGQFFLKKHGLKGEMLFAKAKRGHNEALKIFAEYGYHLGKALSIITYALDPQIIILGGSITQAFKFFEKAMKKSLKEASYKRTFNRLKIAVSANPAIAVLGAAALCYDALKNRPIKKNE